MTILAEHLRDLLSRVERGEVKVKRVLVNHEYKTTGGEGEWAGSEYTGRSSYTFITEEVTDGT